MCKGEKKGGGEGRKSVEIQRKTKKGKMKKGTSWFWVYISEKKYVNDRRENPLMTLTLSVIFL